MICARGSADKSQSGILESLAEFRREIGFIYLGSSAAARPARLEIPLWVWRSGLLERVVDLVRAEVVVGNGYPYAIAAADAAAAMRGGRSRTILCDISTLCRRSRTPLPHLTQGDQQGTQKMTEYNNNPA